MRGPTRRRDLTAARAEDALTDFDELEVQRWLSGDSLRRRSFQLRDNMSA